jgi:hypothetical protein
MSATSKNIREEIKAINKSLIKNCIDRYVARIKRLDNHPEFVCDNHVRDKACEPIIMYKLQNDNGALEMQGQGGRSYVFLVEFDPYNLAYGIYFGCRCTLNTYGKIATQVEACKKEWEQVRSYVIEALNNTFVDLDFSQRELPTDNVSDRTYWPFWFRLGEEEDVEKVAALATKIIRNTYQWFFNKKNYKRIMQDTTDKKGKSGRPKSAVVRVRYTIDGYNSIIERLANAKKYHLDADKKFMLFLQLLEEKGAIVPVPIYEKCWMLEWTITDFSLLFSLFYKKITKVIEQRNQKDAIEWALITPLIVSKDMRSIDYIKSEYNKINVEGTKVHPEDVMNEEILEHINSIMNEIFR